MTNAFPTEFTPWMAALGGLHRYQADIVRHIAYTDASPARKAAFLEDQARVLGTLGERRAALTGWLVLADALGRDPRPGPWLDALAAVDARALRALGRGLGLAATVALRGEASR